MNRFPTELVLGMFVFCLLCIYLCFFFATRGYKASLQWEKEEKEMMVLCPAGSEPVCLPIGGAR